MKKKWIAAILTLALSAGMMAGCGGQQAGSASGSSQAEQAVSSAVSAAGDAAEEAASSAISAAEEAAEEAASSAVSAAEDAADTAASSLSKTDEVDALQSVSDAEGGLDEVDASGVLSSGAGSSGIGATISDASFVLIYNPKLYDENDEVVSTSNLLNTGDLSSQIITGMNRAGELDSGFEAQTMFSQRDLEQQIDLNEMNREGAKAGGLDPVYKVGDSHDFYCFPGGMNIRALETFDCIYAGEHCYIWSQAGSITEADAEEFGKEFDEVIYQKDVDTFGPARFTENGGKVNMLFYPMQQSLGGFFYLYDNFAGTEVSDVQKTMYGLNTDHAIINVNSDMVPVRPAFVKSTLAHEFQHQICGSEYFYYAGAPVMRSWLNEAMSAYAEEIVYPGIKEENGYNEAMYLSDNFRKGQSLYDFGTDDDPYIGAYGAVYLFSQYMDKYAGSDIFGKVHEYWRTAFSDSINEASCLAASVPESFKKDIDEKYAYPSSLDASFASEDEKWMSKLTLDFYMETLAPELAKLEDVKDAMHFAMLYTEVDPQDIEGGGSMLVATENGSYTIPVDSDEGMIYIGLDSDFQPVTDLIVG
ncbi:MAG: hypothetical protein IJ860_10545 [Eubacterium sp.]|nr:hypothetical protein [Eubacterium sp.]